MIRKGWWVIKSLHRRLIFKKFEFPSYLEKPIYISGAPRIEIGRKVRIFPLARIECVQNKGCLIIEDNVTIGPSINITSAKKIVICKGTTISSNVFITDMDHKYQAIGIPIMEQGNKLNTTIIGDNCFIGTGSVLLAGTKLGKQCIIGANSVVRGEFSDYSVICGNPAKVVKYYNEVTNRWERPYD